MTHEPTLAESTAHALVEGFWGKHTHVDPLCALAGLTDEDLDRSPAAGVMTLGEQLSHLNYWAELLLENLTDGEPAWDDAGPMPDYLAECRDWVGFHVRIRDTLLRTIAVIEEAEDLNRLYPAVQSWRFVEIARIALTHFVYHLGQIVLTRKILGLWPPPDE